MGIVILGLIIFLIGAFTGKANSPLSKFRNLLRLGGILVVLIGFVSSTVRIIQPGQVGVKVLFGKVQDGVLYEGLNFVNPLVNIEDFSIRTENYTMSSTSGEGRKAGDDAIRILSNDGLDVIIDLTILYRINPVQAPKIFRTIGINYEEVIIRPVTRTGIRNSASQFDAIDLFADKRTEFEAAIRATIQDTLTNRGFILDQILVRKIDLPASVKESIERKITAIQEAERMEFVLEKEEREAERKRVEARGVADAQDIVSKSLTDKLLQFEQIKMQKELAASNNSKIIVIGGGNTAPPLFFNSK